ncbi:DUF1329 domain-containing protein [Pseudomonas sp. BN414]|uniref:DUF1329 domain-containing protein n=1 Tax=unclassified Pseudomonas TaxID=196821 RepID=UPI0024550BAC|nr:MULTISPECIES: DUF1329 domain-containing protein [unclassified Pseudomonas]MDH4561227.1 DUF1329 domain-containing protein [Pseudomonas sp. BN411]MDH4565452.1 DUF1329 domain-containing protein [Pseudomonas sp. BN414]MDH4656955.1 DUF1329 domain-containing protein [Pseudomonas sp. BN606]MDH4874470.1 DUF1329 domain-containing protein [Pseudomonas sp. BN515]
MNRGRIYSFLCMTLIFKASTIYAAEDLTPWGAIKGANADGSIPVYSDAPTQPPAGFSGEAGHYPDPFANEKPLYSVSNGNQGQYADVLTDGVKELLKRFPSYRVDVYPTHRTHRYSTWELQQIAKNATSAKLVGEGDGVEGSYGPVPFPKPSNGYEVLWNHYNRSEPAAFQFRAWGYLVDASGRPTLIEDLSLKTLKLVHDQRKTSLEGPYKQKTRMTYQGPASQSGTQLLWFYSQNYSKDNQIFYSYTPGQRRVRIAPEFAYDTPVASKGGAIVYDEVSLFEGRPDRFDFKIVGRKEIIVPYNNNRMNEPSATKESVLGKNFISPDWMRWEKHRVWVLEANLKPGKRHIYSKRRFYVDEDSWAILASESYDQAGKLYRVGMMNPVLMYDTGTQWCNSFIIYDLIKNNYSISVWLGGNERNFLKAQKELFAEKEFTPEAVQASGVR